MDLLTRPQLNAAVTGPVHAAAKLGGKLGLGGRLAEGYHSCIFRIRRLSQ